MKFRKVFAGILSLMLSLMLVIPTMADAPDTQELFNTNIGKVDILSNSYIELNNVNIIPYQQGQVVSFNMSVYNRESKDLDFFNYWFNVKTRSGAKYTTKLLKSDQDGDQSKISPNTKRDFQYYAIVGKNVDVRDLVFECIKWDFDFSSPDSNWQRVIGSIFLPDDYTNVVPEKRTGTMVVNNVILESAIDKTILNKNEHDYHASIYLKLTNQGSWSLNLPALNYYVMTSSGLMYSLKALNAENVTIAPKAAKTLQLSGTIPEGVELEGWTLAVTETVESAKIDVPIGVFQLPLSFNSSVQKINEFYDYQNNDGTYGVAIKQLQRLPWEDQDILAFQIAVKNRDDANLPIPELSGYIKLDGVKTDKSQLNVIKQDNLLTLHKDEVTQFILYTKIPYTYSYSNVSLVLNEKRTSGEQAEEFPVSEFKFYTFDFSLPVVNKDKTGKIEDIGKRATIAVHDLNVYKAFNSQVVVIDTALKNDEKRTTNLPKLIGYLKTKDNVYFPMNITDYDKKISPGGKAFVSFWVSVPQSYSLLESKLIVGEAIDNKDDPAFVQASAYVVPLENNKVNEKLENIGINTYNMTIKSLFASINNSVGNIKFNYKLERDGQYEIIPEGHKLLVEVEDGEHTFTQEFEFEKDLLIGDHLAEMTLDMNIQDPLEKVRSFDNFKINFYDQYEGHKKLIASRYIYSITAN